MHLITKSNIEWALGMGIVFISVFLVIVGMSHASTTC